MTSETSRHSSSPETSITGDEGRHGLASLKAQPGSHHHYADTEPVQLATFINARFADEPLLTRILPIDGTDADAFFGAWGDGMLLSVLVDAACEDAVNLGPMRRRSSKPMGVSSRHLTIHHFANLNGALEGCKNIPGLRLGFVGAEDFVQGNRPVILGVGWQLVRLAIIRRVNLLQHEGLSDLFTPEEQAKGFGDPGQEEILLSRWVNHYLEHAGSERRVWSFGQELADGVIWCTLLNTMDPSACPTADEHDPETNASNVITAVQKMGIKGIFVTEEGLLEGERKMNVMFCAQLLDARPKLITPEPKRYEKMRGSISSIFSGKPSPKPSPVKPSERAIGSSSAPPPIPTPTIRRNASSYDSARYYGSEEDDHETTSCSFFSCVTRS